MSPRKKSIVLSFPISLTVCVGKWTWGRHKVGKDDWFVTDRDEHGHGVGGEVYELRDEFMAIRTPENALKFFNEYSCFWLTERHLVSKDKKYLVAVSFMELLQVQAMVMKIRSLPIAIDFRKRIAGFVPTLDTPPFLTPSFDLDTSHKCPRLITEFFQNEDLLSAFFVLSDLERMQKIRWIKCKRKGCNEMFVRGGHKNQIFHSHKCAHCVAMQNSRKRNRKL
jgi:hypothetical protein